MKRLEACTLAIGMAVGAMAAGGVVQRPAGPPAPITIDYPADGSIFPPEITAPTFLWRDPAADSVAWRIEVAFAEGSDPILVQSSGERPRIGEIDPRAIAINNELPKLTPQQAAARSWTPDARTWAAIKKRSVERPATVTITGVRGNPEQVVSRGRLTIITSKDPVGAPIFYRDVPLMPSELEKGVIKPLAPVAMPLIGWRLRYVGEPSGRLILEGLHTCANCHSFSRDGRTLGMDVDGPQDDKGTYAIAAVKPRMSIRTEDVITWNSFPDKPAGHHTIGFLSQLSPDGQYAVSTVNEAVYVANFKDYRFLQVFYPTRGILGWYSRATGQMKALPGADDPRYVHTDAVWSPDGSYLVFARAEAKDPYPESGKPAAYAGDPNETRIQYDLYRIPFNAGIGGRPELIAGAGRNGMSNTFPKVSPDGRWIVFVQCGNGQLMRPDSQLYIVPAAGGQARRMRSNTPLMNSWHSFSPNGRWMVFSSKSRSPYTQMLLTHIDEAGNDSPAILIENATAANRAVNIPEFVNLPAEGLLKIEVPAAEFFRLFDLALELERKGQHEAAIAVWEKALEITPDNAEARTNLGIALWRKGNLGEAIAHFSKAVELNPESPEAHNNLGVALVQRGSFGEASTHFRKVLEVNPESAEARNNLGVALLQQERFDEAITHFEKVLEVNPKSAEVHNNIGRALARKGRWDEAIAHWKMALDVNPDDAEANFGLGTAYYLRKRIPEALARFRQGLRAESNDVPVLSQVAWILATCPDASVRNGAEAVGFAERAVQRSGGADPAAIDALAAAYAEVGRFPEAAQTARRALALARQRNMPSLAQALQARISLYEAGTPFRETR